MTSAVARCAALAIGLASCAAPAAAATYRLDPTHSFVHVEIDHFATATIRIRIGPVEGDVELDRDARKGSVGLRIPTSRVSSGVAALDKRLAERDLLGSDEHPEAFYVAERFVFDGDRLAEVRGEFTLKGITQGLVLRALRFNCYTSPLLKREVCGGDFEGELKRSTFGATLGLPLVGDRVRLAVQVEAVRQ